MRAPYAPTNIFFILCHLTLCVRANVSSDETTPPRPYNEAIDNGSEGYYPIFDYATESSIISPKTNWLQWDPRCNDGLYYFITPRGWGIQRPGPMILDWKGDLVWTQHFANEYGGQAYDFKMQQYQGQEYLTFWTGDDRVRGHGAGSYLMLNASYDIAHKVNAANDHAADLHEFLITPEDTALLTVYQKFPYDVSEFREFNATENENDADPNWIWDGIFQEIEIENNNLIFEWRASDHIPINQTYHTIWGAGNHEDPFDWFHINSVQKDQLGNYLISARYTHGIYYIDGKSGDVLWVLGGKGNQFLDLSDGFGINFAWQHDARFIPSDSFPSVYTAPQEKEGYSTALLSLFDNAAEDRNYDYGIDLSRGLLLEVTYPTPKSKTSANEDTLHRSSAPKEPKSRRDQFQDLDPLNREKLEQTNGTNPDYTVRVIKSYENPNRVRSSSQGSVQILPQGDDQDSKVFVGYGLNAVFTEFDANGSVLCDAHFGAVTSWERGDIQSYRAYKFPWSGWPTKKPEIGISDDDVEVWVSWNGATEVVEWVLQAADSASSNEADWTDLERKTKQSFETTFQIPERRIGTHRYLRALAISSHGKILEHGASQILDRGLLASFFPGMSKTLPDNVARSSGTNILLCVLAVLVAIFACYEGSRRYLSYKHGTPAVGAVRWRKGAGYRLLGDA